MIFLSLWRIFKVKESKTWSGSRHDMAVTGVDTLPEKPYYACVSKS